MPAGGGPALEVEGQGRSELRAARRDLDCGNSATAMRLVAGVVAASPFRTRLVGDASLSSRPMDRVAAPLREMGADVETTEGHAPLWIGGGALHGIRFRGRVPSAQVKGAVLLAGVAADGETVVEETAATRDHTERALAYLGASVLAGANTVAVRRFQHEGFEGTVPGDPSSAAFLVVGAALTGSELTVHLVGVNPTRTRYLEVMRRMGVPIETVSIGDSVGEPVGDVHVLEAGDITSSTVTLSELPLVIDEVPALAALAVHGDGETRFLGAGELRVKESDRLAGLTKGIHDLGGDAEVVGDSLVVAGGGLAGGVADAAGDHRLAMALTVGALAARGPSEIVGIEAADVSFPGFVEVLRSLGAPVQVAS